MNAPEAGDDTYLVLVIQAEINHRLKFCELPNALRSISTEWAGNTIHIKFIFGLPQAEELTEFAYDFSTYVIAAYCDPILIYEEIVFNDASLDGKTLEIEVFRP